MFTLCMNINKSMLTYCTRTYDALTHSRSDTPITRTPVQIDNTRSHKHIRYQHNQRHYCRHCRCKGTHTRAHTPDHTQGHTHALTHIEYTHDTHACTRHTHTHTRTRAHKTNTCTWTHAHGHTHTHTHTHTVTDSARHRYWGRGCGEVVLMVTLRRGYGYAECTNRIGVWECEWELTSAQACMSEQCMVYVVWTVSVNEWVCVCVCVCVRARASECMSENMRERSFE